jgi:hypothetical protein
MIAGKAGAPMSKNGIRPYGPGKFDTIIDSWLYYSICLVDQCGDSAELGEWYGLANGPLLSDCRGALTPQEAKFLDRCVGAIISETSDGFVWVQYFTNKRKLRREWQEIQHEMQKFEEQLNFTTTNIH